jgi:hypothetical protein
MKYVTLCVIVRIVTALETLELSGHSVFVSETLELAGLSVFVSPRK